MNSSQRGPTAAAPSYGVTWGGLPMYARRAMTVGLATLVAAGVTGPATAQAAEASSAEQVSVIVRELPGAGNAPERAVAGYGGEVGRALDIINGFTAEVPVDRHEAQRSVPGFK
jgi:serine protease AprX